MLYRFLFKSADEQRFRKGEMFDDEKETILFVMNFEDLHPELQCGYIEES